MIDDVKTAFFTAWSIVSTVLFLFALSPFFIAEDRLLNASAMMQTHAEGERCFLCGTTRAFIEIAHGNISNAFAYNELAAVFYVIFLANGVLAVIFTARKLFLKVAKCR